MRIGSMEIDSEMLDGITIDDVMVVMDLINSWERVKKVIQELNLFDGMYILCIMVAYYAKKMNIDNDVFMKLLTRIIKDSGDKLRKIVSVAD